jgi:hypothetical protein
MKINMWPFTSVKSIENKLRNLSEAIVSLQSKVNGLVGLNLWVQHKGSRVDEIDLSCQVMSERIRVLEQIIESQRLEKAQDKAQKAVKARAKPSRRVKK